MPSWARENKLATSLPNLNRLDFFGCRMEDLTCLGNLRHLKFLNLIGCGKLKYIFEKSALAGGSDPNGLFPRLRKLVMNYLRELQGWTNIGEGVGDNNHINSSFSMAPIPLPQLTFLWIEDCPNLTISECPNVNLLGEEEGMNTIGMPWPSFSHSLRNLTTTNDWMPKLTSLRILRFFCCSKRLKERCQQPTGEDWPHIQHIPSIQFHE
ncbi:uncharacterized protein LOC110717722 [Chenopodium quinoa]|uniref:uncharacterized protein LOC110717722 n=1 Tax=Chenopodium quinoa TaxID=63459 RepID=UPI000B78EC73|nr:uncharacterized protein LOC110717722 [Chenopodium quinoa]